MNDILSKKNFLINLVASFSSVFMSILFSLWLTPFALKNIGPELYGFIPLTQNYVNFFSVITVALSAVISKFLIEAYHKKSISELETVLSTYFYSFIFLTITMLLLLEPLINMTLLILEVPNTMIDDVKWLLRFSYITFLVGFINTMYISIQFTVNKIYLSKNSEMFGVISKAAIIIVFFNLISPNLFYIGLAVMVSSIMVLIINFISYKKILPDVRIKISRFNFLKLKQMVRLGFWSSINQVGVLLFLSFELIIINLFLGAKITGIYAALSQFPVLIRTFSNIVASTFAPIIITLYAQKKTIELKKYINSSLITNGLLMGFPIALIVIFGPDFVSIWLGSEYEKYSWIMTFQVLYLGLILSTLPLGHLFTASDKLKFPAIVTIILGMVNISLSIILTKYTTIGLWGVLISAFITLLLKNYIFIPFYSSNILGLEKSKIYKIIHVSQLPGLFSIIIFKFIFPQQSNGLIELIPNVFLVTVFYLATTLIFSPRMSKKALYSLMKKIKGMF